MLGPAIAPPIGGTFGGVGKWSSNVSVWNGRVLTIRLLRSYRVCSKLLVLEGDAILTRGVWVVRVPSFLFFLSGDVAFECQEGKVCGNDEGEPVWASVAPEEPHCVGVGE